MNIKSISSTNFKSKVPTNLKLNRSQYAIANAYTNKESNIVKAQYESLPIAIQTAMSLQKGNSNRFKTWDVLQKAFFDNEIIKQFFLNNSNLFQYVKMLLENNMIANFIQSSLNLEKTLFLLNQEDTNLQEKIDYTFKKYDLNKINEQGNEIINQIEKCRAQEEELEILREISTLNPADWNDTTKNYAQFLSNVIDKIVPQAKNLKTAEKASLFKLMNIVQFDVSNLGVKIGQKYDELIDSTINKKELLNYADEPVLTNDQINDFYTQNKCKIMKSIILLDLPPLNSQLDHKIDKFIRTINIIDEISNDEQLAKLLYDCTNKIKYPEDKIKLVELIKGFMDINETNKLKVELEKMNANKKIDVTLINNLAKKYLTELTGCAIDNHNINIGLIHTFPSAIARFNNIRMPEYSSYLIDLIKTIAENTNDSKMNYLKYINSIKSEIGLANQDTKKQFLNHNLNFDTWINYNRKNEFKNDATNENMSVGVWQRNVGYDIFQGNYSGICVATNGKNAFGSVDALLNTNVQIIEIKNEKKTIGNAYTYWAKAPNSQTPVFVIDGVTLDRKYQNDECIKQNLLKYALQYAREVIGEHNVVLYIGEHYNSISIDEYQPLTIPLQIIGNTGSRKYYLDSLANQKYVHIDGIKSYDTDVRYIDNL